MKRRRQLPDNRLDWRDPDMPVMRMGNMNTDPPDAKPYLMSISAKEIQNFHRWSLSHTNEPIFRNDPSYWWSKNGK